MSQLIHDLLSARLWLALRPPDTGWVMMLKKPVKWSMWPAPWIQVVLDEPVDQQTVPGALRIVVRALPDGSIHVTGMEAGQPDREYWTVPIILPAETRFEFVFAWVEGHPELGLAVWAEGRPIPSSEAPFGTRFVLAAPEPLPDPPSLEHPDARSACDYWLRWRREKFPLKVNLDRVPLSDAAQLSQLERAARRLGEASAEAEAGATDRLPEISAALRGLLYWDLSKKAELRASYDPLLLRLAARGDLPLPVYFPEDPIGFRLQTGYYATIRQVPVTRRESEGQRLLDLQGWLDGTLLYEPLPGATDADAERHRHYSVKDCIAAVADTEGGCHFDSSIPKEIARLRSTRQDVHDSVDIMLFGAGKLIADLGLWTAGELRRQGFGR